MRKTILMCVLCLAGALLNILFNSLVVSPGLPLYMDTVLTVALTFYGGLLWGTLCGALTNLILNTIWFEGGELYLYALCNMAAALVTWLFIRYFPRELDLSSRQAEYKQRLVTAGIERRSGNLAGLMNRAIVLTLLAFVLCLAMSILGGLITAIVLEINSAQYGQRAFAGILSSVMFGNNVPMLLTEILARIPINIIDRLIAAFGGYAVALGLRKLQKKAMISSIKNKQVLP